MSIAELRDSPFLCGCLAQRFQGSTTTTGWRAGVILAASADEALGRFLRDCKATDPDFLFSAFSAEPLSQETRTAIVELEALIAQGGAHAG